MQSPPSPDVIDWKHDFRKHQAPTDQVVSGNAPVVTNQNRLVSDGAKAPVGVKYDTAWMLKHKLLQAMKESDDKQPISGNSFSSMMSTGGERRGGKRVGARQARRRLWQQWP